MRMEAAHPPAGDGLIDLGPSILELFGVRVPGYMRGRSVFRGGGTSLDDSGAGFDEDGAGSHENGERPGKKGEGA